MIISVVRKRETSRARVNEQIVGSEIRVIGSEGEQVGVISAQKALALAEEKGLDLVEISPAAKPPVCRIMDYGKYLFEQNKKQALARKKQKQVQIKELKFRPATEEGDYQVKLRNLIRFLEHGDKVKITVRFRGREAAYHNQGSVLLERVQKDASHVGIVEQTTKFEGRQLLMVLGPKKK